MQQHEHLEQSDDGDHGGVMSRERVIWSVFAKPWADLSGAQLAKVVAGMGFTGVEIPVRATSYVTPERVESRLPVFIGQLADAGVVPISVAGDLTEPVFAACQASGVPTIRVMAPIEADGYVASVARFRAQLQQSARWARQYGVKVGVQPHHGPYVASTHAALELLDGLAHADFTLIWDAAHDALAGDDPAITLEIAAPRLDIVNLKNAVYRQLAPEPADEQLRTRWRSWFVEGHEGLSDWSAVLGELRRRHYAGAICLSGQYTELQRPLEEVVANDLALARRLYDEADAGR